MIDLNLRELRNRLGREADQAIVAKDLLLLNAIRAEAESKYVLDEARLAGVRIAFLNGDVAEGLRLVEEALQLNPLHLAAHTWKVFLLTISRRYELAVEAANHGLMALGFFSRVQLNFYKGQAYEQMGDLDRARFCYLLVIEEDETQAVGYLGLLRIMVAREEWEEVGDIAVRLMDRVKAEPRILNESAGALLRAAEVAARSGREDVDERLSGVARQQLEVALERAPADISILYNLACSFGRMGDSVRAVEFLRRVLEANDDPSVRRNWIEKARADVDFARIRGEGRFEELLRAEMHQGAT